MKANTITELRKLREGYDCRCVQLAHVMKIEDEKIELTTFHFHDAIAYSADQLVSSAEEDKSLQHHDQHTMPFFVK